MVEQRQPARRFRAHNGCDNLEAQSRRCKPGRRAGPRHKRRRTAAWHSVAVAAGPMSGRGAPALCRLRVSGGAKGDVGSMATAMAEFRGTQALRRRGVAAGHHQKNRQPRRQRDHNKPPRFHMELDLSSEFGSGGRPGVDRVFPPPPGQCRCAGAFLDGVFSPSSSCLRYFSGSLLKSFRQLLQHSLISRP